MQRVLRHDISKPTTENYILHETGTNNSVTIVILAMWKSWTLTQYWASVVMTTRKILKWIIQNVRVRMWTEFIRLCRGSSANRKCLKYDSNAMKLLMYKTPLVPDEHTIKMESQLAIPVNWQHCQTSGQPIETAVIVVPLIGQFPALWQHVSP
jgi:hypothetical protein